MEVLGLFILCAMYFYVVYKLNFKTDEDKKNTGQVAAPASLVITVSRFFDKNSWGS
jgi:hypothetical protein